MKREDREVALIVGIVIIVSSISLIAVLYFLWQLVGPPITAFINGIGDLVTANQTNYNFPYPGYSGETNAPKSTFKSPKPNYYASNIKRLRQVESFLANSNYNFPYPGDTATKSSPRVLFAGQRDVPFTTNELTQILERPTVYESQLKLSIPAQEINGQLLSGYDLTNILSRGFWIVPGSRPLGHGTLVTYCYRRYSLPYQNSSSCWYLDQVKPGDRIEISKNDSLVAAFIVDRVEVVDRERLSVFDTTDANLLRIVSAHPVGSNRERIVITALPTKI